MLLRSSLTYFGFSLVTKLVPVSNWEKGKKGGGGGGGGGQEAYKEYQVAENIQSFSVHGHHQNQNYTNTFKLSAIQAV